MTLTRSSYSGWNAGKSWSSQEWKSDEMLGARTRRPVGGQQFTQETHEFVIDDDDDMDSDTAAESNFSLKSLSFLHRVNDREQKIQDLQHWKHLQSWGRFAWKFCIPSKKYRIRSHFGIVAILAQAISCSNLCCSRA